MTDPRSGVARQVALTSSLHFDSWQAFNAADHGSPVLPGQTVSGLDNGYGLQGNPTNHGLQAAIATLEHGTHSLLYPSGLTALTALGSLLRSGDHWLIPKGVYWPVRRFAGDLQARFNITFDVYDPASGDAIADLITPATKLIHIESPCSVTFETAPVAAIASLARRHGILASADNTWASGVLCQPLDLGVDLSVLSLTKYAAGYSDVFMGSITTTDDALFESLAYHHRVQGYTVSPFSSMLVQRGLETLPVRIAAHAANAAQLIEVVRREAPAATIHSAGPETSSELSGSNGLFSVVLDRRYSDAELESVLHGLDVYRIGESWGGTRSLVLPFQPDDESASADELAANPTILRFHTGLEDIGRQSADITKILARVRA